MMWKAVRIGDLGKVITGKTPSSNDPEYFGDEYPFITPTDMDGKRKVVTARKISEEGYHKFRNQMLPIDSVCFVCIGSIGKLCITSETSLTNQQINSVVVNRSQYDPFFVYYVLSTFTEKVASIAGGVATPIVNKTSFENITLLSPPLTIQRKIAAILSAYDDLIENNLRRIKILEEMAQNLYREWFVKFRFPGYEKVKFVDSPLGMIPEGWDIVKLSDIGRIITGKTPSKAIKTNFGEYLPFIKTPDMHEGIFVFDTGESLSEQGATSQANKSIPAGTICVSCIGTIGIVCIATRPAQTNQQINSLILSNEKQREYIFFSLKAAKQTLINLGANGATMGNVNKGKFEALKVVAPSEEYFTLFHLNSVSIFRQIYTLSAANKNLKKTRDILIPKLISGEVDVSDLNIKVSEEVFE